MKTFSVDSQTSDLQTQNGFLVIATGRDCIAQQCSQAMRTILGEMLYAADKGIPYFQVVWTGSPNLLAFEAAARAALLAVPGVLFVNSFSARIAANELIYSVELSTTDGTVTING